MIRILHLDHLVLTVRDLDATIRWYTDILGMELVTFGENRKALKFGNQKINLHPIPTEINLVADKPSAGSADLCFITATPLEEVIATLKSKNVPTLTDIVERTGANGKILSIYLRDPDLNLIELSNYPD